MCCFNKVNLSAILLVHKRIINKDCTVKNNNEVKTTQYKNIIRIPAPSGIQALETSVPEFGDGTRGRPYLRTRQLRYSFLY